MGFVARFWRWADDGLRVVVRYPLLNGQILLVLLLAWGVVGGELGVEALFWNEFGWQQFLAGAATAWLFGVVVYLNVLLAEPDSLRFVARPGEPEANDEERRPRWSLFPTPAKQSAVVRQVGAWLLWWLVALGLLVLAGKLVAAAVYIWWEAPRTEGVVGFLSAWVEYLDARWFGRWFVLGYEVSLFFALCLHWLDNYLGQYLWTRGGTDQRLITDTRPIREKLAGARWLRPAFSRPPEDPTDEQRRREHGLRLLHAIAVYLSVVTAVLTVVFVALSQIWSFTPAPLTSLTLIVIDLIAGVIVFRVRYHRTLGLAAFLVVLLLGWNSLWAWLGVDEPGPYRLTLPHLGPDCVGELDLEPKPDPNNPNIPPGLMQDPYRVAYHRARPNGSTALVNSLEPVKVLEKKGKDLGGKKPRLVLVTTSGGGIRAAVWTGVVLEGLEQEVTAGTPTQFRDHVRMFTGASGGMVAAAAYEGDFPNGPLPTEPTDERTWLRPFTAALADDSLSPVVQTMVLRDFTWTSVLPWPVKRDRGRTLEDTWESNFRKHGRWKAGSPLSLPILQLREDERNGLRPSVVFSPIMVEDTKRMLITNLDLGELTEPTALRLAPPPAKLAGPRGRAVPSARGATGADAAVTGTTALVPLPSPGSLPAVEFFRLFPGATEFQIGTAARVSASFPVVSPAVNLPMKPARRLVDAGYFDNYGIDVAAQWLLAHRDELKKHTSGVLLIQIRAYPIEDAGMRFVDVPPDPLDRLLGAVSAPAQALTTARGSAAHHRNTQLLRVVHEAFNDDPSRLDFFATAVFEMDQPAALSWYLTSAEKRDIVKGFYDDRERKRVSAKTIPVLEGVKVWFGTGWR